VEFGPKQRLLWKRPLPIGHSSPVVWGDRVFLNSFDADSKKLELICVAAKTGEILWRRVAPAPQLEKPHEVSNPATASPAVDAERVYSYFGSYGLMTFNHAGEQQWILPLPMPKTQHGSGASPLLAGDFLILNHDASQGGYLLAVNRRTGKEVWKQIYAEPRGRESYSTPIAWRDQLILHRAGFVEGYRLSDGHRMWAHATGTSGASSPAAAADPGNLVFVSTWNILGEDDLRPPLPDFAALLKLYDKNGDGKISEAEFPEETLIMTARPELERVPRSQNYVAFRGVDRNRDNFLDTTEWENYRTRVSEMMLDHGLLAIRPDGEKAEVMWREKTSIPEIPSPLLYQGRLYLIRNGGVITCLDAATGKIVYRARVGAPGPYFASPVEGAGRIYLASSEGVVTVLAAGKDQLEVLARNKIGEDGDQIVATPAIAGKVIYVRTSRNLYAFGDR
jgi:outer membrane protein assembly factor BamB